MLHSRLLQQPEAHAEGRVRLASGWWSWYLTVEGAPDGGRWLVFWHEAHQDWGFRVKIDFGWNGAPGPEQLARGAMRLTVHGDRTREVFFLADHIFVHRGKGDVGVLLQHDGRRLVDMREEELLSLVAR